LRGKVNGGPRLSLLGRESTKRRVPGIYRFKEDIAGSSFSLIKYKCLDSLLHLLSTSRITLSIAMCPPSSFAHSTSATANSVNPGSVVPETQVSRSAYAHASSLLAPSILNHSMRVYLYVSALAKHTNSIYISNAFKHDLLFTACLFHDIGTTETYDGPFRFEVEGADAAVKHLKQFGVSEQDQHDVWTAIAIHTSPHIAERIGELSKLVRLAVIMDFGRRNEAWDVLEPLRAKLEQDFERCGIEKVLGDAVVEQATRRPEKAPMVSWPGVMYKAHLTEPDWVGVNKAF
jgi:HD superfamily phosphohydrolase YqeK